MFISEVLPRIILGLSIAALVFLGVLLAKNEVTLRQHVRITHAIFEYHMDVINNHPLGNYIYDVNYGDEEDYDKTLWRLWDWGCTRILPKEKFEIIKPYLKRYKECQINTRN
jgi:hypothetical protein